MAVKRGGLAVYPIGSVMRQTGLTGRQIRYYEQMLLIEPTRSKGNQRLYSDADVERLTDIKRLLDEGYNIEGIRTIMEREGPRKSAGLAPFTGDVGNPAASEAPTARIAHDLLEGSTGREDEVVDPPSLVDAEGPLCEVTGLFLRDNKLVSLYPVNNRARLENLLLSKQSKDADE